MSDVDFTYEERRHAGAQFFRDLALEMIELSASDLAKPLPDPLRSHDDGLPPAGRVRKGAELGP